MQPSRASNVHLYTIGHSNHSTNRFLELLQAHAIKELVDIRRFPGSRNHPQFNREDLATTLADAGIVYHWFEALGGRRSPSKSGRPSPNGGLRNASFRNYADYMLTDEFQRGIEELESIAAKTPTAMMCAEGLFWQCHRRLVSDYLAAHGAVVEHIFPNGALKPHSMTPGAELSEGGVIYPAAKTLFDDQKD